MDRRGFLASIPAAASVAIGAGTLASTGSAHAGPNEEIVRFIYQVEGSEAMEQATAALTDAATVMQATKDAHYDELAALYLELEAQGLDTPEHRHFHDLFRWEINGYAKAMRMAYPEDCNLSFSLEWAKARANGRIPIQMEDRMFAGLALTAPEHTRA